MTKLSSPPRHCKHIYFYLKTRGGSSFLHYISQSTHLKQRWMPTSLPSAKGNPYAGWDQWEASKNESCSEAQWCGWLSRRWKICTRKSVVQAQDPVRAGKRRENSLVPGNSLGQPHHERTSFHCSANAEVFSSCKGRNL